MEAQPNAKAMKKKPSDKKNCWICEQQNHQTHQGMLNRFAGRGQNRSGKSWFGTGKATGPCWKNHVVMLSFERPWWTRTVNAITLSRPNKQTYRKLRRTRKKLNKRLPNKGVTVTQARLMQRVPCRI